MTSNHLAVRVGRRMVLVASLALIFAVAVVAGGVAVWLTGTQTERAAVVDRVVAPVVAPVIPSPESVFGTSRIHVLVLGRDYDYTANDIEYSTSSRSDAIMAFTVDFPSQSITEISVPRDTAVTMPDGSRQKINAALSDGGVQESKQVISDFLGGVTFDRYVLLRIDSTKALIDAIGGIEVPVQQAVDYDDSWGHLHIHLKPGMHHMNGDQAVSYSRFRHDWCGDPCRIARQQDVLHAIAAKLRNDKLNDLVHARELISIISKNVSTDFSSRELISLAWSFRDVDPRAIQTAQVPFSGNVELADGDALVPDDVAKTKLVDRLMLGPLGDDQAPDAGAVAGISPKTIPVEIQNGTQVDGPGDLLAARLRKTGFAQVAVVSADRLDYSSSEIHVAAGHTGLAAKVRASLGPAWSATQILPDLPGDAGRKVVVVLGSDLVAVR